MLAQEVLRANLRAGAAWDADRDFPDVAGWSDLLHSEDRAVEVMLDPMNEAVTSGSDLDRLSSVLEVDRPYGVRAAKQLFEAEAEAAPPKRSGSGTASGCCGWSHRPCQAPGQVACLMLVLRAVEPA